MKRRWIIGAVIALLGVTGYLLYNRAVSAMAARDYTNWPPSAAAIRQQLGGTGNTALSTEARLELFCKLFQNRYREHDPMMAIGLRPINLTRLKLMCPARLEPVDIDRIALSAWHESQGDFGHPFEIDIYATFIGTSPVKIGELRLQPDNPKIAHIVYHYPETIVIPLPRQRSYSGRSPSPGMSPGKDAPAGSVVVPLYNRKAASEEPQ
jgi:hypothetical protein